jgi:hypothetical protein
VRHGTAEDDEIEEGVGTKSVSTVDRHASSLTTSVQTRNNLVLTSLIHSDNLTSVAGRDTTHVVVDSGQHGNGLLADVNTSKDTSSLRDTRQTLSKNLCGQMAQLQVDVVLLRADTTAVTDLHGHRPGDNVTGSQILSGRGISLHETLTLRVQEVTTLTTGALGDEATGAIDTSGVELDEFEILVGEAGTGNHGHTVTSASMSRCAAEVSTAVATGSQNSVVSKEAVQGTVLLVVGQDTTALSVLHDQVKGEVLDEVVGIVAERLSVESVEKSMASSVGSSAATVCLSTLAVLL